MSIYVFHSFLDCVVCFFLILSCMSCLYILEINPLSVASFANIFSHSEGCLFIFFTVSFAVQKLLSFIRSQNPLLASPTLYYKHTYMYLHMCVYILTIYCSIYHIYIYVFKCSWIQSNLITNKQSTILQLTNKQTNKYYYYRSS